jgi:hypothetical protein
MEQIKVGDKVRVRENIPKDYVSGSDHIFTEVENTVVNVTDSRAIIRAYGNHFLSIPTKYLIKVEDGAKEPKPKYHKGDKVWFQGGVHVITQDGYYQKVWGKYTYMIGDVCYDVSEDELQPYTESTEDKNSLAAPESAETLQILSEEKHLRNLSQNIGNCDKWEQYTADLAKEIAVKSLEKSYGVDPERIAEYAVKVAKAVVEGLKKK